MNWLRRDLRYDLPASLVVFLVAVPLSLGIAVASGAPIVAGLVAAVVGGIVAAAVGGSPLLVSGPAAGLTVVVAGFIDQFGWAVTCGITVAAGVLQLVLGLCRVARAALAISPAVVHGMLAGIGLVIVLGQLHVLLGGQPGTSALTNLLELPGQLLDLHGPAALIGLLVLGVLLLWGFLPAPVRRVPGPLVAVLLATVLAEVAGLDLVRVDLPGSLLESLRLPQLPGGDWGAVLLAVLTLTVIASVESLLSAVAVDKLAGTRSDLDRELFGQGAANTASGLLGGLPVTGVIVRGSTNVAAGARTRASAILHGVWVLLFVLLLAGVIERVPMAALAGLLVFIGLQLVRIEDVRSAWRHREALAYLATASGVVFLDLLQGVLIGLAVSVVLVLRRVVWARVRVTESAPGRWRVQVEGTLSFLSLPRLSRMLGQIPDRSTVDIELVADFLDHAAYEHLSGWRRQHEERGGTVVVAELGADRKPVLPRWFAPWSSWQGELPRPRSGSPLETGVREYHRHSAPLLRPLFEQLAVLQRPHGLFLTCADSRIVPNMITTSGPGDLFTVRNVGNLVPPGDDGIEASVHVAVEVLRVPTLMVCGHSACAGMTSLLSGRADQDDSLGRWLRAGLPSLRAFHAGHPAGAGEQEEADRLAKVNVAVQAEALARLPMVRAAVAEGRLQVIGLFFDIGQARLSILDPETQRFRPLDPDGAVPTVGTGTRRTAD
ncbi:MULTISPECIES: bifunctional SulP family inorganic anion transporter/carbonic anhydrase [unclassified Crossiella]|uniref:SulP family inorganic anion transporter n=1 Tax=unclassified Crossiella TaxID=2620835 RepID=UPI001FFFBA14|nr:MULTISPECIES: bifunctional SulP family inorganic anion transporter/carbonic anhydrase [unclassified Crossiella]MCK2243796.1 bifunctional SulP family inorganic anion transporter/carbonic anhydrase [Crossiella sp. S99.2]MCK2257655.1 bifunctional SulP family inorganic anion transporter/carbonic anhydrase [Crossiella sp. S99.1]